MSFLNQLKAQADAVQRQNTEQKRQFDTQTALTESACKTAWNYLGDLARQLDVLQPAAPRFTLDGKSAWPAMKLVRFRVDARRKTLQGREVFDYIGMGWQIVPQVGPVAEGSVSVNFPPELERVIARLSLGMVQSQRHEIRHPDKNTLQAIRFDYMTEARGSITITPDHELGVLAFRIVNATGFELQSSQWPAEQIQPPLLDELAKLLVGEPSRFI